LEAADPETELARLVENWSRLQARAAGDDPETAQIYERFLQRAEPPLLRAVLDACDHNRAAAAQLLGMHRTTLRQKMRRYGID
jgi:DNA-binding protein Fis